MKGVTHSVLYLLYIQENCVRASMGGGGGGNNWHFLRTVVFKHVLDSFLINITQQ